MGRRPSGGQGQNRTGESPPSGIAGGPAETWTMVELGTHLAYRKSECWKLSAYSYARRRSIPTVFDHQANQTWRSPVGNAPGRLARSPSDESRSGDTPQAVKGHRGECIMADFDFILCGGGHNALICA